MRKTHLVCYDICDDRRLAKVHKTLRGFGDHLPAPMARTSRATKATVRDARRDMKDI